MNDEQYQLCLTQLKRLKEMADLNVTGVADISVHDGWGVNEHAVYSRAMNDAISILETEGTQ